MWWSLTVLRARLTTRASTSARSPVSAKSCVSAYAIHVSVLEIYNELIHDLLSAAPDAKLDVKLHAEGGVHVPGLTCVHVQSVQDVNEVT